MHSCNVTIMHIYDYCIQYIAAVVACSQDKTKATACVVAMKITCKDKSQSLPTPPSQPTERETRVYYSIARLAMFLSE